MAVDSFTVGLEVDSLVQVDSMSPQLESVLVDEDTDSTMGCVKIVDVTEDSCTEGLEIGSLVQADRELNPCLQLG